MDIVIQRENLLKALQLVSGAIQKSQALPVLSNVLLAIHQGKLAVTATDTEIELMGYADIDQVNEDRSITVSARKLMEIARSLPEGAKLSIKEDQKKNKILISSQRSQFTLVPLPSSEFPKTADDQYSVRFDLSQKELKRLFQATHFAMAQQDVRYYLKGMLFDVDGELFRVVATDAHRLALVTLPEKISATTNTRVIVPRKGILELLRLLQDADQKASVLLGQHHIRIISDEFLFTSKLIDGKFPDFNRVIPKTCDKVAVINRMEFKQALARAAILCNEKYHGVAVRFQENLLVIQANNPEQEEATEEVEMDYQKATVEIGFNVNYILDVLNAIDSEKIRISLLDSHTSVVIEPAEGGDGLYVVMPMRL